jgi:hypothetical protein
MIDLKFGSFPEKNGIQRFQWWPVLIQAVVDSPERLLVAAVVVGERDHVVIHGNSLQKLECLYSKSDAEFLRIVTEESCSELRDALVEHAENWSHDLCFSFANVFLGECANCFGETAERAADMVLAAHSSLHKLGDHDTLLSTLPDMGKTLKFETDKLPWQVYDFLQNSTPILAANFSSEIIKKRRRRRRLDAHIVQVDYRGKRLAANLGTLGLNGYSNSIDLLKRQLWDLKVFRDTERIVSKGLTHELFVYHRDFADPLVSSKEADMIKSALYGLEQQADLEEVRLRPFIDVPSIGRQIQSIELAA